ncbi:MULTISPECIES: type II toxin-antitoxin system VapC family toxin [unclassified Thioalkalivibrio]|uniref:type II toxin-antitoxin system VapC family toxin n=1 Tax=unclassified Thioalkalivibrio TaxID=2621013 RepID=UPI00037661A2|nr:MULTISPECIES: type II toxin-antitoxin system VapC family toxin [unclassified Thioalkalivibrio]
MVAVKAVFDTNILVDYLNGQPQAAEEFALYPVRLISQITWMEILVGCKEKQEEQEVRQFLETFEITPIDQPIAEAAVQLRKTHRLRLPDAIILATADTQGALLVTRDTKAFSPELPGIRVPYRL